MVKSPLPESLRTVVSRLPVPATVWQHPYAANLLVRGYCHPTDLADGDIWDLLPLPCSDFYRAVYRAVVQIPPGDTVTYAAVAARVGNPRAARAIGQAMARNLYPLLIPCHRVVATSGIGGYLYGLETKTDLLALEKNAT